MRLTSGAAVALLFATPLVPVELPGERERLVVHEWGTFTSIASEEGTPVRWAPLSGPADLPCFVARLGPVNFKDRAFGFVRMETPVLYFYSPLPVTLSVRVAFPEGWITEWYPKATQVTPDHAGAVPPARYKDGEIRWDGVEVLPGENPQFPVGKGASHYYAARQTDAAPLRIGTQWEKLIFYRGVGEFPIPLRPVFTNGNRVRITNAGQEIIPLVILFENRGGKIGYRLSGSLRSATELAFPELTGDVEELQTGLVNHLVEFGLYRKEARAMVETWRDSWFEEGMRVFYIVPREMVDRVLPLGINPAPLSTARVFVGRIELLSPAMRETIETAAQANDLRTLERIGRFLGPFAARMERDNPSRQRPAAIQSLFRRPAESAACVN